MKKALKWLAGIITILVLLGAGTAFYLNNTAQNRLAKKYDVQPKAIAVPTDSSAIAAGQKWANYLCSGCHGSNFAGTRFFESPDLGTIFAPNLTPGGVGGAYTDLDWVRAIRHGIANDGRPLLIMPSRDFQHLSDEHTGQIIAYLKSLAPTEQLWDKPKTTLLCNILFQTGAFGDALNAETIDHSAPPHFAPPRAENAEYGQYLVRLGGCRACHGEQLNGGKDPNPEAPMGPNLTPGGNLPAWKAEGFVKAMRTGVTPLGKELNRKFMPWEPIGKLDDDQLKAVYAYLMSQPRLETAPADH